MNEVHHFYGTFASVQKLSHNWKKHSTPLLKISSFHFLPYFTSTPLNDANPTTLDPFCVHINRNQFQIKNTDLLKRIKWKRILALHLGATD